MIPVEPAGASDDLTEAYRLQRIAQRSNEGKKALVRARYLLATSMCDDDQIDAENFARQGLRCLARALDWAEDSPEEGAAHTALDDAGRWVHEAFGCSLAFENGSYFQRCPVPLAHNRLGMSIGGVAKRRTCSLCGEDVSECPHDRGTAYLVAGGPEDLGWCRVCLSKDSCPHAADQQYRAPVVSIISEMTLVEVSLVSKPAHPEARIESMSINIQDLQAALGPEFEVGIDVACDRCASSCAGLIRHDWPHGSLPNLG